MAQGEAARAAAADSLIGLSTRRSTTSPRRCADSPRASAAAAPRPFWLRSTSSKASDAGELGQKRRPLVEEVVVAHPQRVQGRRLSLQQGGQPGRAEVVVADVQQPQAAEEGRLLASRRAPARGISHRSSRSSFSSRRQGAVAMHSAPSSFEDVLAEVQRFQPQIGAGVAELGHRLAVKPAAAQGQLLQRTPHAASGASARKPGRRTSLPDSVRERTRANPAQPARVSIPAALMIGSS